MALSRRRANNSSALRIKKREKKKKSIFCKDVILPFLVNAIHILIKND
jgi:hypothetical protein